MRKDGDDVTSTIPPTSAAPPTGRGWDDLIIGAGTAGSVLAARLSQDPDRRVLLVEAGGAPAPAAGPEPIGKPVLLGSNWDYLAYTGPAGPGQRQFPYSVGRVLGGSSAVNGAIALRGLPEDFADWAAQGNPLWSWDAVAPIFRRIENDADAKGPAHGHDGPVPIRRESAEDFAPLARAFRQECLALGLEELADLNEDGRPGVGVVPTTTEAGRRVSSAMAYLDPVADRQNLTVWTDAEATSVVLREGRAVGARFVHAGGAAEITADRVTLCAGAVNTPLILERSGIGDPARLAALGIPVALEAPGVGENLSEHAAMAVWAVPRAGACRDGAPWHSVLARVASAGTRPDLILSMLSNVATAGVPIIGDIVGNRVAATVSAMLLRPVSRGRVHLAGPTPAGAPEIELAMASAPQDVEALAAAARLVWSAVRGAHLGPELERVLIWTDRMMADEALLRRSIPKFVAPLWHPAGTAKMGPDGDPGAVVDQRLRVRGVEGLRIVDASVMPAVISGPTALTCLVLGERAAEWMA